MGRPGARSGRSRIWVWQEVGFLAGLVPGLAGLGSGSGRSGARSGRRSDFWQVWCQDSGRSGLVWSGLVPGLAGLVSDLAGLVSGLVSGVRKFWSGLRLVSGMVSGV